jgi:benzoyl-CoA reductase/2-hydroxyglutaryl-CoA dehydratase subunit BcrC/BadD/HgdB
MTLATKRGLPRFYEYRERVRAIIGMIEQSPAPNPVQLGLLRLLQANDERIIDAAENDKPLVSIWYGNAPEIFAAMDIVAFCPFDNLKVHLPLTEWRDLEAADKHPLPADVCSLIRMSAYAVEAGLLPTPTAMVAMTTPCDAQPALHEMWKNVDEWRDVPTFVLDPSYSTSASDFSYFAGELKRMIQFLEQQTGKKMDLSRLRQVIEESNLQYEIMAELNECRRAKPCPYPSFMPSEVTWGITQHLRSGDTEGTTVLRMLQGFGEQQVKAKQGAVPKENIRILWADLVPVYYEEFGAWLAEKWGAVVVQDFQGDSPYEPIDTSTEESMLLGLAKRSLHESPMIRQARGYADVMVSDITRIVKDYKIDCVFFPGHMGHKDQSASVHIIKETCRSLKVPLFAFTSSNFDPRYTPMDVLKTKVSEFFEATGLV